MNTRLLVLLAACAVMGQAQSCGRECLRGLLDTYLLGMTRHDASKLNVTPSVKFTENGAVMKLGEGLWRTAGPVTYKLYALDPEGSAAAVEAVVKENGALTTFLLRIKVAGKAISEAETIVCRKGQYDPSAPQKLTAAPALFLQMVAKPERMSRKDLAAIADAYFTAIQTEGTPQYKPVPLAEGMNRFENGEQTTNVPVFGMPAASASEQLEKGFFKGLGVSKRRFPVVDVEYGIVLGIGLMSVQGFGNILFGEMFKMTGGKIRQIQAVLVNHPKTAPTGWN